MSDGVPDGVDGAPDFDYLVLGAGPAGLQLGHHLATAGRSYLILEAADAPGTSFARFPHRRPPTADPVAGAGDRRDLRDPEIALRYDFVSLLTADGGRRFPGGGREGSPSPPSPNDLADYLGDYARHYGLAVRCGTEVVRVERRRARAGARAAGFRLLDRAGNAFTGRWLIVAAGLTRPAAPAAGDADALCAGCRFDDSIFAADCRPALTIQDRFPALTCEWESTDVPGLYFAGALTRSRDFKQSASGLIHGFRYNTRALHRMLEAKHHGRELPWREVEPTAEGLAAATLARVERSSALWHQHGFLHDVIVLAECGPARYYEELPLAYVQESELGASSCYCTVALERDPLHPVVRRWNGPLLVAEHRLAEEAGAPAESLRRFFAAQLAGCLVGCRA